MLSQHQSQRQAKCRPQGRSSRRALVSLLLLALMFLMSATSWAETVYRCRFDGVVRAERCCGHVAADPVVEGAAWEAGCCDAQTLSKAVPAGETNLRPGHGPELATGPVGVVLSSVEASALSARAHSEQTRQSGSGPPILLLTRSLLI